MPPTVAPHPRPPRQNPSKGEVPPPPDRAAPMANPNLGLGAAPYRRAPRLAKRRHAASASARSRAPPAPSAPWNPFGADGLEQEAAGNSELGSGEGSVVGDFGIGKGQSAGFVFSAGVAGSHLSPELALGSEPAASSAAPFEFGSVRESLPRFERGWSASSKLPDKMRKLNLRSSGNIGGGGKGVGPKEVVGKDGGSIFGVDVGLVRNSEESVLQEKMTQLDIGTGAPVQGTGSEGANRAPEVFVFGGNTANGFVVSRTEAASGANANASGSLHGTEASVLAQNITQFNIGNGAPLWGTGSESANYAPQFFVFGSNTTSGHAHSRNDVASGANTSSSNAVHGSEANVLPEKMTQLNIGSGTPLQDMKGGNASCVPEVFAFGSSRTSDTIFGQAATSTLDKSSDFFSARNCSSFGSANGIDKSLPPEKTTDLNMGHGVMSQSMKNDNANCLPEVLVFGSNGTTSVLSGQSSSRVMDDGSSFVTSANADDCTSAHGTGANILPEKMTMLDIGCGVPSQSTKNENAKQPREVFSFGSNGTTSFSSGQTASMAFTSFQTNVSSEPQNNRTNLSNEGPRNSACSRANDDNSHGRSFFIFGNGSNSTTHSEGAAAHGLHDEIKKLNISRESGGCNKVNDSSAPVQFSFHSKSEATSGYCAVSQPKVQEQCDPVTPSNSSSSFPTFQNTVPNFSFRTMHAGRGTAPGESGTVKQDASGYPVGSLFGLEHIKSSYRDKKGEYSTRKKKRPTRLKQRGQLQQSVFQEACTNGPDLELVGDYSPMDCSPYTAAVEQVSREASVTSDQSAQVYCSSASNRNSSCAEEDLVSATEQLVIDGDLSACKEEGTSHDSYASESNFVSSLSSFDDDANLCNAQPCFGNVNIGTTEAKADCHGYSTDGQTSEENTKQTVPKAGEPSAFQSRAATFSGLNFTFGASPPPENSSSAQRRTSRRKLRVKGGQTSKGSATHAFVQPNTSQETVGVQFFSETGNKEDSRKEHAAIDASISAALETCETWRTSGNQAYANGHFATAEDYYTRGISSISHHVTSGCCSRSLMLCYSNRAATRMSLGRMREALQDCLTATSIDPSFLKARIRAANCQLALGDLQGASESYTECLQSNNISTSDSKLCVEASDGLERVKRVADWISQSKELLKRRTFPEARSALELISNALHISSHSDSLMEMKAEVLLMLRRYGEVIQLCQETIDLAERNSVLFSGESKNFGASERTECSARLWRSYLICKSYFLQGKLEEALDLLKKHEQVTPAKESHGSTSAECFSSLSATIRKLLSLKASGNESFQASRYSEAVEHYSAALACNSESRSFSAVCFCNRAAAYQALGQVTDAIADCSLAIVLDATYPKAISRRATLYEMIRDYAQAANDLRKLISLLERQVNQSGLSPKVSNKHSDLRQARARLSSVEDEAKKVIPLNLYLILGVEPSCSAADVKKAYRKAALRHHPDKAAQLLVRNENADDGFWRDIAKEVYADADHLFKTIGEAYNVLSDPDKRQEYDTEEELRNAMKRNFKGRSVHRSPEQHYSRQYDSGFNPRQWRPTRSGSRSRWSGYSDDFW